MAKRKAAPSKKRPQPASGTLAAREEPKAYRDDPKARLAPYDNLYDAIRGDMKELGIKGFDLKLPKRGGRFPPLDDE